ncbi:hypothetical protein M3O75_26385 [Klebsiella pneumoniae]|nr:hypothetical protein [Klebsiella pneumoniae]
MLRQNKLNAHLENREMKNCCRLRRRMLSGWNRR